VIGFLYLDSPHWIREFMVNGLNFVTVMANIAAIRIEHGASSKWSKSASRSSGNWSARPKSNAAFCPPQRLSSVLFSTITDVGCRATLSTLD
jgi:hypothetical protein